MDMAKKLKSCTFIDGTHCLTETNYKDHKIYKVTHRGLEFYQILKDEKLIGMFSKLIYAKDEIDKMETKWLFYGSF